MRNSASLSDLQHSSRNSGLAAGLGNVLRSPFNNVSSSSTPPQRRVHSQAAERPSRQQTRSQAVSTADRSNTTAFSAPPLVPDQPCSAPAVADAVALASRYPGLMSKDSPLADRLGALATLLPELKNKQLTNISSLWRSLTDIVRFAFGSDLPQAMHELQLSSSSCTSSTSTDSGLQTSARRLLLDLLVELSKNGHTQGGFDEDADEARQEMLHAISSASGWEETALAVRCVAWASCGARRLEGDPASWFKRAKEWSDQAIGQCYPEDNTSRDPLKEPPDDLCACMSASLDFLASIIREEYPVLDPDFVSETVANLCSKATHTRPVKENGTEKAAWVWTKHEHLFSVLKLLMALINFGALSQELLCPGILLLCTTVSVPMCNVLCCGIINRIFTSCYMRDGLLAMNCILHDDKSPQNSMHIYGKSDMTLHQDAIIGTVYFITKVMDTGLTDIQFRLRVGSFLPVLGKAAQCMHPEVLCLIFQYLCTIVDDARAKSMLPDDWHALIGILETTVGCRLAGVCDDHEHAPSAKLYSRALSSAIRFFRQRSTRASASLIGLIYRLRGVISDEIALRMLEFIDISGRPPPGAADWLAMLDEVMKLYYFDRARGIMLRRCAIRLCSKSFAEESAVSLSDIEHASFVLPMLEQLRMEVDGKLVEYALEILGPLLRHTRNPGILSKILQFSADAVLGVGCSWPIEQLSRPMSTDGNSQPAGKCECAGYMRIPCVVKCLLDAFEWHMHNTDSAGDEELALSHSMAIMLANTLLDLLESKHALLSVRCDILSVFLRLHADASSRLYILQTGRDTVMDQRIDIREKSYMKVATTKRVVLDNGSTQVVTVKFPVDRYVRILTGMLGSSLDPEMYYTLSQGLIPQLGNTYLFIACPGEIQELLARLIARYKLGPFGQEVHMHLSAEEKNKVSALSYGLLTSAVHYNSLLRRDQQDVLIAAFIDGLTVNSTTSTTPQICLHGLTVSILEMPNAVVRSLPHILHQLVMISSSPQISVHLLEFLSAISYEKTIYQTLRAEDYRAIFGVATSYIRFHNNKRRQLNASSTSSKRASLGSSSNNSNSPSTPTEPSISETALKQYVLVMAYQVIQVYFLSLSPNLRAATVSSILQRLLETNFNTESLDELNEVILDMILHNFNNPSSNLLNQELAVKEDLGSVAERTWIQHNSLVTIRAQRSGPLAQIIVRSPSAATSRVVDLPDEVARKYAERSKPATQSPPAGFASTSRSLAATPCSLSPSISTTNTHLQSIASTIPRGWAGHIAGRNHRLHPMAGPGSAGSLEANTLPSDAIAKLLCGELVTAQGSASRPVHFPIKFGPAPCVAQEFISAYPGLQNIDPPVLLPTESQAVSRSLSNLDYAITIDTYKVSVTYVGPGQTTEREILLNQQGSPAYWNFLRGLGKITRLSGLKGYSAGLDTSGQDLDGRYTIKWRDLISQLVFHVGTLMPDCQNKNERLVRKKSHMGNDFVHIVFNESGRDYEFDTIPSEFNYVQIIVAPVDGSIPSHEADSSWLYGDTGDAETKCVQLYKVKTQTNASIPFVGPAMEPKLLTLTALPAFVRTIAIHAAILSQVYSECKKNKGISEFISPWRARLQAIKRIRVAAEKEAAKQSPHVRCPPASRGQSNSLPDFSRATAEQALDHLTNELSLFYNSRY